MNFLKIVKIRFSKKGKKFFRDLSTLKNQENKGEFVYGRYRPILNEDSDDAGKMSGHYFHQDLLVSQRIFANSPDRHLDIGSRTDGFVAHVAAFREIELLDIRPMKTSPVRNIKFKQADITKIKQSDYEYCDSVSSLHAIEHIGLGRYGDDISYYGYKEALKSIVLLLKPGGKFYFSVPIGVVQRIEFNGHRIFTIPYLVNLLEKNYKIDRFSYVDDYGDLHDKVSYSDVKAFNSFGLNYGCGIFELTKQ